MRHRRVVVALAQPGDEKRLAVDKARLGQAIAAGKEGVIRRAERADRGESPI